MAGSRCAPRTVLPSRARGSGGAVSAGPACSSGKVAAPHVLRAMGAAGDDAIRVSLGWDTVPAHADRLVEAWGALYARTRANATAAA